MRVETTAAAKRPSGAPFYIEQLPFHAGMGISIASYDYSHRDIPEDVIIDWPLVYILSNEREAYVGQTTSAVQRMSQHGANKEKSAFTRVNVIYNEEFNASVITDYEHRLIQYMQADGTYQLTNKNDGLTDSRYFSKSEYDQMFEDLWDKLRQYDLASKSIREIEESEVFKYSPFKCLNADQHRALDEILAAVDAGMASAKPLLVEGMPGTGKTVLAVYLLKALKDMGLDGEHAHAPYRGLNVRLLEPMTSLRETLRESLKGVSNISKDDILGPMDLIKPAYGYRRGEKCYDILLVDEAHHLKQRKNLGTQFANFDAVNRELGLDGDATQLDWVLKLSRMPILFYDPLQVTGPSGVGDARMRAALGERAGSPIRLESQMRVKGGDEYLDYVRAILDGRDVSPRTFDNYEFVLHLDFGEFEASFERTLEHHSLTRMVAGYAWPWATRKRGKSQQDYDIEIDGVRKRWNCTYENWVIRGTSNADIAREVGCIHSTQGYDLSYAYVIIGPDLRRNPASGAIEAVKSSYFDRNGKATATDEELNAYIRNIYYVLLTRGIYGTHVYVCDGPLRDAFMRYVRTVKE